MTGKTHRVGGMLSALTGYVILSKTGYLIDGVSPILQLAMLYPFSIYGSIMSDLDHNRASCPSKDIVSMGINRVLHLTTSIRDKVVNKKSSTYHVLGIFDAKHRSWQTHSDLTLILLMLGLYSVFFNQAVPGINGVLLTLMLTGLLLGLISHMLLDLITPEGIWCLSRLAIGKFLNIKVKDKISLVPNTSFFRTGGKWEDIVRRIMWVLSFLVVGYLFYTYLPFEITIGV